MKRYIIVGVVWACLSLTMIQGNARAEIRYQISYDQNTKETYTLKEEIQEVYRDLVYGVHKESYILMVLHNKERFKVNDNIQVEWKQNTLQIVEGDGKGDVITGTLRTDSVCIPEVQPRSFLQELFSFS